MFVPTPEFWRERKVLVTGHTGFKGSWLTCLLRSLGSVVHGVALPDPPTTPDLWGQLALGPVSETRADLVSTEWQEAAVAFDPDVVIHLAAQSLVSVGLEQPAETFRTNVQGTVAVLSALDHFTDLSAALVITTDKVYDSRQPSPYSEDAFLGGSDPYSASKAAVEHLVGSWPHTRAAIGSARAGNVIGGGDWARHRLVPDLVRAWTAGENVVLRMPEATRPWQHVMEPLLGYLAYAEALAGNPAIPRAMNFGPRRAASASVVDLVGHAAAEWRRLVPGSDPAWSITKDRPFDEAQTLALDSRAAETLLDWSTQWSWRMSVTRTLEWYTQVSSGTAPLTVTEAQVAEYLRMGRHG